MLPGLKSIKSKPDSLTDLLAVTVTHMFLRARRKRLSMESGRGGLNETRATASVLEVVAHALPTHPSRTGVTHGGVTRGCENARTGWWESPAKSEEHDLRIWATIRRTTYSPTPHSVRQ